MEDGRHFEKRYTLYRRNSLTIFEKIWYGDAHWPSQPEWLLKI